MKVNGLTVEEKGLELFNYFFDSDYGGYGFLPTKKSKELAIFVVEEIILANSNDIEYWENVKMFINNHNPYIDEK